MHMKTVQEGGAVHIHDATLSEGEAALGVRFETGHAVEIARLLAQLGVEHLEVARTWSDPGELERVQALTVLKTGSLVGVRARSVPSEIEAALAAGAQFVNVGGGLTAASGDARLPGSPGEAVRSVRESMAMIRARGALAVFTYEEDTRPSSPVEMQVVLELCGAAVSAGAARIVWADTLGVAAPELVAERVRALRNALASTPIEVQVYDDRGLATANTLAALAAGATWAHTSVNGLGPRAGLADLSVIIANLLYTGQWPRGSTSLLKDLSVRVASYARAFVDDRRPVVGRHSLDEASAFVAPSQVGRQPVPFEGGLPRDLAKLFLTPFVKSATELRYHREGPGRRFVMIDERLVPDCRQYCIVREIPQVEAPAAHVDTHVHTCDSLFMFLGMEEGMKGLKVEVILDTTIQVLESPAAVFIPAGTSHTYRIVRGRGYYMNHVLSGRYNDSLLDPLKPAP